MKFQDFQGLFKHYFLVFKDSTQKSHLSNNNIIVFQILINELIKQNGTKKVQHMQRMQWLWQL